MNDKNHQATVSETMRYYVEVGMINKAIQLGKDNFKDDFATKELIKIYLKQGDLESAQKIVNENLYNYYFVTILLEYYLENNMIEEAMDISVKFKLSDYIQSKIIKALIRNNQFKEAIDIAVKFPDNQIITAQLANAYYLDGQDKKLFEMIDDNSNNVNIISIELKWMLDAGLIDDATSLAMNNDDDIMRGQVVSTLFDNKKFKELNEIYNKTTKQALKYRIYHLIKKHIECIKNVEELETLSRYI